MKRCLVLQHFAHEGLGVFRPPFLARGWSLHESMVTRPEHVPIDAAGADYDLLLVLGGSLGVNDTERHPFLVREIELVRERLRAGRPTLGLCLGAQVMARALGAEVRPAPRREVGWYPITLNDAGAADPIARSWLQPSPIQLHWHEDTFDPPPGATILAHSERCAAQAFRFDRSYGLQFHPEFEPESAGEWIRFDREFILGPPLTQSAEEIEVGTQHHAKAQRERAAGFLGLYLRSLE